MDKSMQPVSWFVIRSRDDERQELLKAGHEVSLNVPSDAGWTPTAAIRPETADRPGTSRSSTTASKTSLGPFLAMGSHHECGPPDESSCIQGQKNQGTGLRPWVGCIETTPPSQESRRLSIDLKR